MPRFSSHTTPAFMPLPYSDVVYVAPLFFSRVLLPQRSLTTTSFATSDSLNSHASNSGLCHCVSVSSHSPSLKMIEGLYFVTRSLNCGNMCSVTKRGLSVFHKGLNHS